MHNIEAVVAQELKTLVLSASLAQRVWCAVKAQKKIFQGQRPPYLIWKGIDCSVCTIRWM